MTGVLTTALLAGPIGSEPKVRFLDVLDAEGLAAAGEGPQRSKPPVVVSPHIGVNADRVRVALVHVQATCLATPVRSRLPEPRCDRDDDAAHVARDHLELVPFADGTLVDVTGEDQLRAGIDQRCQDVCAPGDRLLPRTPRRADQVVVESHDSQRALRGFCEYLARVR